MSTLTLEIPDELDAALRIESARRQLSPAVLVREALEHLLVREEEQPTAASQWLSRWRGSLCDTAEVAADEVRVTDLLKKHLH